MDPLQRFNAWLGAVFTGGNAGSWWRFVLLFLVAFLVLAAAYQALEGTPIYRFYLDTLTVRPTAALVGLFTPQAQVAAQGSHLIWRGGALTVNNGCDGMEVIQLLIAAFVAYPGPWRQRLLGAFLGLLLVYGLNEFRLVALYYAARHDRAWFELLHGLVGPLIVIAVTTLFFAWWIGRDEHPRAA